MFWGFFCSFFYGLFFSAVCAALHMHTLLAAARCSLHTCGANGEQHSGAVHAGVCAEGAAVETAIMLRHTCELQAHIQVVGAEQPTHLPARRGQLGPLALPHQTPGFSVNHLFHSDCVNRFVAPALAADGHVVVLGGLQRAVGPGCVRGGGGGLLTAAAAAAVVTFFWGQVWRTQEISLHRDTSQKFHTLYYSSLIPNKQPFAFFIEKQTEFPFLTIIYCHYINVQ